MNRDKEIKNINNEIKKKSEKNNLIFYNIEDLICANKKCTVMNESNLLLTDEDHWSYQGFMYYGKKLIENNFLKLILNNAK